MFIANVMVTLVEQNDRPADSTYKNERVFKDGIRTNSSLIIQVERFVKLIFFSSYLFEMSLCLFSKKGGD